MNKETTFSCVNMQNWHSNNRDPGQVCSDIVDPAQLSSRRGGPTFCPQPSSSRNGLFWAVINASASAAAAAVAAYASAIPEAAAASSLATRKTSCFALLFAFAFAART